MRVLLVDDNPEFLKAAERLLSRTPHLEVVGCASSGEEALVQTKALRPKLVVMDWSLPDMNGWEATRRIKSQPNPPRVLILSLQDYPEYRLAAKEAGAEGFIPKSEFGQKIPSLIDYLVAQEDLQNLGHLNSSGRPGGKDPIPPFEKSPFASGTADRPPAGQPSQPRPELSKTLRDSLTALEAHYLYLQHWLEGGGKDSAPEQRDQALKQACRNIGQALRGIQGEIQELQPTLVRNFLGPFPGAAAYYLLFKIRQELYALPADQVLSVEKPAPLIQLPREYQPLVGLADINRRRTPIIDLRLWEKSDLAPPGEAGRLILVETKGVAAGLLVDAVGDLTTSAAPEGYPLPSDPVVSRKPFRDRLILVKDRFLYVWDVDKIIACLK